MRALKLSPALFLFTLLMSPALLSNTVYADTVTCCKGSCIPLLCKCSGSDPDCPWQPESKNNGISEIKTVLEAFPVIKENFLNVARVSQCFRDRVHFNLLGNALRDLKFKTYSF